MIAIDFCRNDQVANRYVFDASCNTYEEGCLSIPGVYLQVVRPSVVEVSFRDEFGRPRRMKVDGLLARCIQHEMDHLMGKVFVEYLSLLKRNRIKTKLLKQARENERR